MQQQRGTAGDPIPGAGYHQDFALWLECQATLLRARRFDLLDLDNLAEEIDAVAQSLHREGPGWKPCSCICSSASSSPNRNPAAGSARCASNALKWRA